MWLLKLVLFVESLFFIEYTVVQSHNPWCDQEHNCINQFTRQRSMHTMCKYQKIGPGCETAKHGLTVEEKALILNLHNNERAKVARGEMEGQPGATNMMRLEWDDDLAEIAQRWASQCRVLGHDDCHNSWSGEGAGQNIAWMQFGNSWSLTVDRITDLSTLVNEWVYKEVGDMYPHYVSSYPMSTQKPIGHYTQVVWAETTRVGCGVALLSYPANGMSMFEYKLVCNYVAQGNVITRPVYLEGYQPATQCPSGAVPSVKYPGLCEYQKNYYDFSDQLVDSSNSNKEDTIPTQQAVTSPTVKPASHTTSQRPFKPKIIPVKGREERSQKPSSESQSWCDEEHYCRNQFTGQRSMHTMCKYQEVGPGCETASHGLTVEEKALILNLHNNERAKVARGEMEGQPGATNMMRLEWDDGVAEIAQRWASQCTVLGHDDCNESWSGEGAGQNVAWMQFGNSWGSTVDRIADLTTLVNEWVYKEVGNMYNHYVSSYPMTTQKAIGHYTQVVWAETTRVGCGVALLSYPENGMTMFEYKLVCNYIAQGNVVTLPVYLQGHKSASQCPSDAVPSVKYPGLCEYQKNYYDFSDQLVDSSNSNKKGPSHTVTPAGQTTSQKPSKPISIPIKWQEKNTQKPSFQSQPNTISTKPAQQAGSTFTAKPSSENQRPYKPLSTPVKDSVKGSPKPSMHTHPNTVNTKPTQQPTSVTNYNWGNLPIVGIFFKRKQTQSPVNTPSKNPQTSKNNQIIPQAQQKPAQASPATEYKPRRQQIPIFSNVDQNEGTPDQDETYSPPKNTEYPMYSSSNRVRNPITDPTDDTFGSMWKKHDDFQRRVMADHDDFMKKFQGMGFQGMHEPFTTPFSPYSRSNTVGFSGGDLQNLGGQRSYRTVQPIPIRSFGNDDY